jgi:hypothetical protein
MTDETRKLDANGVMISQSMLFFAAADMGWRTGHMPARLKMAEDVFAAVIQTYPEPSKAFAYPIDLDATVPRGEVIVIDKDGEIVGTIYNVGNPGLIPEPVKTIADAAGGTVTEVGYLPDGSGFATMSSPLPKNHWLYANHPNIPPMPFRLGQNEFFMYASREKFGPEGGQDASLAHSIGRSSFTRAIVAAGKYAIRCSTLNGADDFDPDAMLQNLVVGMIGYWTDTGLTDDACANPERPFNFELET